jgi:hypothetical protein
MMHRAWFLLGVSAWLFAVPAESFQRPPLGHLDAFRLSLLGSLYLPYGAAPVGFTLESVYGAAAISGLLQIRIYI